MKIKKTRVLLGNMREYIRKLRVLLGIMSFVVLSAFSILFFTKTVNAKDVKVEKKEKSELKNKKDDKEATSDLKDRKKALKKLIEKHKKVIYLTFDDGPSERTNEVLDVLKKYNVKATFFVIGKTDKKSAEIYKRIVDEGHSIGLHSYTHKFSYIYKNLENFKKDFDKIDKLIFKTTGVKSKLFRFPGGSNNRVHKVKMNTLIKFLKDKGIEYYDWNAMTGDAVRVRPSLNQMFKKVTTEIQYRGSEKIVLTHDSKPHRNVAKLTEQVIKWANKKNYCFLPIDDTTTPIHAKISKNF